MTNDELVDAIIGLLSCYEEMEQSQLRIEVHVAASRLLDELRQRGIGLSNRGQEAA